MAMSVIWCGMLVVSLVYAGMSGRMDAVTAALTQGAGDAVTLCIGLCGAVCFWSGILEVMDQAGLSAKLARGLRPLLKRLFPRHAGDKETMEAISANLSANLLGLGNAATPMGIRAAQRMAVDGAAGNDLCTFVVLNTASLQLLPTTVAALRAAAGAQAPFDILPAVWLTSAFSVTVGLLAAKGLARLFP